jgi:hypothetical protein
MAPEGETVCWALPPLKRQGDITDASATNPHFKSWAQRCSTVSEPSQDKAAAVAAPVIDDEDLYG